MNEERKQKLLRDWNVGIITSVHKQGDNKDRKNDDDEV